MEHILVRRGGQRRDIRPALEEARKPGITVATVVCCNMTSLSHTRYGSARGSPGGDRHGSRRAVAR